MNKQQAKEICVGDVIECKSETRGLRFFIVTDKIKNGSDISYSGYYCEPNSSVLTHKEFDSVSGKNPYLIDRRDYVFR